MRRLRRCFSVAAARRTFDLAVGSRGYRPGIRVGSAAGTLGQSRPGLRIPGAWDPFECAVRAVLGQQVSVAAGRTLAARLVARAGQEITTGIEGLTHLFPSPAAVDAANLDGLGITGARIRALKEMARAVMEGRSISLCRRRRLRLRSALLPGFGDWTAQYVSPPSARGAGRLPERGLDSAACCRVSTARL